MESMRRGVPLLRSDSDRTGTALRLSMTSSFNRWIPFCGANSKEKKGELEATGISDPYVWRASYLPALNVDSQFVCDEKQDFDMLRFGLSEWRRVSPYLLCEFYPLTPWHKEKDTTGFTAFCYYDPEREEGVLLAFRQEKCPVEKLAVRLPFIKKGERYRLSDEDTLEEITCEGAASLSFSSPRSARLLWLKKMK